MMTMNKKMMNDYIEAIGRCELYDELEDIQKPEYIFIRLNQPHPYPRYLKAIQVSLVALGYDEGWVTSTFKEALEEKYLNHKDEA